MAYYYVKFGGTATGTVGYSSPKTGSWSTAFNNTSEYYNNLTTVLNSVSEVSGDFIIVSNAHNSQTVLTGDLYVYSTIVNVCVISVDDNDLSLPSIGATETYQHSNTSGAYLRFSFSYAYGLNIVVSSELNFEMYQAYSIPSKHTYEHCSFSIINTPSNSKFFRINYSTTFLNCYFDLGPSDLYIFKVHSYSGIVSFKDCVFKSTTSSSIPLIVNETLLASSTYRKVIEFDGCDFSQANRPIFEISATSSYSRYIQKCSVIRCLEAPNSRNNILYGGYLDPIGFFYSGSNKYLAIQYYALGIVDSDTSVYRTDGPEYASGYYFCYKVTSRNEITDSNPFTFKLLDFYLDTINPRTFTVEFAQSEGSTPLTDYQFSIDVFYIDDTTPKAIRETTTKILPSSTDLATSSKTWTGLTNPVKQYVSLTTSQTGSYGLCSVYVNIFVPNKIIYICPKVDIT
jgi:hypothetical protein